MRLLLAIACASLSLSAFATVGGASPAMVARPDADAARAEQSFESFADAWIAEAMRRGESASEAPRARSGAAGLVFTYQSVDESFETELRPTGRPAAPFVGVLHYTEHTYTCTDARGDDCRVTSSLPVTEVFRFRDGKWSY